MLSILLALQANAQSQAAGDGLAFTAEVDQAYLDHLEQLDILADRTHPVAVDFTAEVPPDDTSTGPVPDPPAPTSSSTFAAQITLSAPACYAGDSSRTEMGFTSTTSTRTSEKTSKLGFTGTRPPTGQIDTGAVSVFAGSSQAGSPVGHVLATAPGPNTDARTESWFWTSDSFDKFGGSYSLRMINAKADADWMTNHLDATGGNWQEDPFADIFFDYIAKPKKSDTDLAVYGGPKVSRYQFMLIQNNVTVGAMLRERHGWGGQTKFIVEHWLFFEGFKSLQKDGDRVYITKVNTTPPNAAAFFTGYESCAITSYAQPIYHHGATGSDFVE